MGDIEALRAELANCGVEIDAQRAGLLCSYADALRAENSRVNLTAVSDTAGMRQKHLIDCIVPAAKLGFCGPLLDVGTGGGLPGAALKIFDPSLSVTLLDATAKKLDAVARMLAATGVECNLLCGRAEQLAHDGAYREQYATVTARAVANLASLCEYCLPFVRVGGLLAAYKGPSAEQEAADAAAAIAALGGKLEYIWNYELPDGSRRALVGVRKISQTLTKYPRRQKNITKNPLR